MGFLLDVVREVDAYEIPLGWAHGKFRGKASHAILKKKIYYAQKDAHNPRFNNKNRSDSTFGSTEWIKR